MQLKNKDDSYQILGRMYIPAITLQAFSAELYLKALIINEGKQIRRIHKLDELWDMLSETENKTISSKMISEICKEKNLDKEKYGTGGLKDDFIKAANTFEDWKVFF